MSIEDIENKERKLTMRNILFVPASYILINAMVVLFESGSSNYTGSTEDLGAGAAVVGMAAIVGLCGLILLAIWYYMLITSVKIMPVGSMYRKWNKALMFLPLVLIIFFILFSII